MSENTEKSSAEWENEVKQLQERVKVLESKMDKVELLLSDFYRYEKLHDLLEAGDFKAADQATIDLILEIAQQQDRDEFTPDHMLNFPCSPLRVIDKLWKTYSDGRFGFSQQKEIYLSVGGQNDITEIDMSMLEKMGDVIGWRVNGKWLKAEEFDFSINAPVGSLPCSWLRTPFGAKMVIYSFARLIDCHV
jgi:hypothetical protein